MKNLSVTLDDFFLNKNDLLDLMSSLLNFKIYRNHGSEIKALLIVLSVAKGAGKLSLPLLP